MKNSKNKGNSFERLIAKKLSEWAGVTFMRTPASGAIHNFNDRRVVSDIVPPLSIGRFPFSIECKKVECNWEFSSMLEGTSLTLGSHWSQCTQDAFREGLCPMLIFSKNYHQIYTILQEKDYLRFGMSINPALFLTTPNVIIFNFEDFLSNVTLSQLTSYTGDILSSYDNVISELENPKPIEHIETKRVKA